MEKDFSLADSMKDKGFGDIHLTHCSQTGLMAIIAIHSTHRGPAIGGCRCLPYAHVNDAISDAMQLGRAMSYKAAIHELPHGGGKAVLIRPETIPDREAYFRRFAECVAQLNGRYITSVDSGTSTDDMNIILESTPYVLGYNREEEHYSNDPSILTARGVKHAIAAAVEHKLQRSLEDIHVAIQGTGHVGGELCRLLIEAGATVTVADIDRARAEAVGQAHGAQVVDNQDILQTACDVLAPCALGGVIHPDNISLLQCSIICGAANNQLSDISLDHELSKKNIVYIPDYLANGGGLIFVASNHINDSDAVMLDKIDAMYPRVKNILQQAAIQGITPLTACNAIAEANME
jgi:leucine dehydrogenase